MSQLGNWLYERAIVNWKSSLAGILSTVVSLTAAGFFAPNPFINTKVSGYAFAASGMARILLGLLTHDTKGK
jgi:uncharacterized membrane protein HdeD (DUF308 family)